MPPYALPTTSPSSINGATAPRFDPGSRCVPMSRLLATDSRSVEDDADVTGNAAAPRMGKAVPS